MGYFVKKNRAITSKLIKQEVIDKEVNIDAAIQDSIVEEVNIIPEKKDIKKKTHIQEEPVYKTTIKPTIEKKEVTAIQPVKKEEVVKIDLTDKATIKMKIGIHNPSSHILDRGEGGLDSADT